jgi:outer membrane lipoprotein SlyB
MMTSRHRHHSLSITALALAAAATLAACGAGDAPSASAQATPAKAAPAAPVVHADRGRIAAIEPVTQAGKPTGAGAVVGGVLGAALGNQIGGGDGRKVATVAGAVGGAAVGHNVEKQRTEPVVVGYRVTVRMDDGSTRSLQPSQVGDLRVGDRVRLDGGAISRV